MFLQDNNSFSLPFCHFHYLSTGKTFAMLNHAFNSPGFFILPIIKKFAHFKSKSCLIFISFKEIKTMHSTIDSLVMKDTKQSSFCIL